MRILIIGLGSIAKKHVAAIRELEPEAEIYALRSSDDAPTYGNVVNIHSLADSVGKFDFAIISNPTSKHAETIERALELDIPLFIEKPVFGELGHEALLERVRSRGVLTYVACNLRFLDSVRYLHDYVRSHPEKRVNEVNVYCGSYLPEWRPGTDYRRCYSALPELGGGVHMDLIHDIDYICWIFGNPEESFGICRSVSSLGISSVDYANYTLIYPQFTATVILNYYRRDYKRTIEVVFQDCTWTVDLRRNEIKTEEGKVVYSGANTPLETYKAQMGYFLRLLREGKKAENDMESAYDVLKICLRNERP